MITFEQSVKEQDRAALDAALNRLGLTLCDEKKLLLLQHLYLVQDYNRKLNLTSITDTQEGVVLHIEDSLAILPEFLDYQGRFIDIGTGGGFPGIPLAIVSGYKGLLIDSVDKKIKALHEIIGGLSLENQVHAISLRSEELAVTDPESFDIVIARAVASLNVIEELATPLLCPDGHLISLTATLSSEDENIALKASKILGLTLVKSRSFCIGDGISRSVYVFQRVSTPSVTLPRRPGMAKKRPYGVK